MTINNAYLVGIKGAGMAALAVLLRKRGLSVAGCDVSETFFTDRILQGAGIVPDLFSGTIPDGIETVIYSTAWATSAEVSFARQRGIACMPYAEAVALLFNESFGIAVCGSHGKTTTSALIAYIFHALGKDPSAIIGSEMTQLGTNALAGASQFFILEADEYQNKLALYQPHAIVVTNVDYDHPDFFADESEYSAVFADFASRTAGPVVACWDDPGVRRVVGERSHVVRYGSDGAFAYSFSDYRMADGRGFAQLYKEGKALGDVVVRLPGRHSILNALGAFAVCDTLEIGTPDAIIRTIGEFQGTRRRFEEKGLFGDVRVIDDYAHHPAEIRATLSAAREAFPGKRIWCIFGPHTVSRTTAFFDDFAKSFADCDRVLLLDVYASARESGTHAGLSSPLAERISLVSGNAEYVGTHANALERIQECADDIDVLITMGAGDTNAIGEELVSLAHSRA